MFLCHKSCHSLLQNCFTEDVTKKWSNIHTKALTLVYQQKIRMNDGLRCVWRLCTYRWSCECCEQSIEGAGVQQGTCATSWLANSYLSTPPHNWKLDQKIKQASLFKLILPLNGPCNSDFTPLAGVQWKRALTSDWWRSDKGQVFITKRSDVCVPTWTIFLQDGERVREAVRADGQHGACHQLRNQHQTAGQATSGEVLFISTMLKH